MALVSTGYEVWELRVVGQVYNNTWTNIGVRWKKPDLNADFRILPKELWGGLEIFINKEPVGHTVLPETTGRVFKVIK